ncbi:MAG: hypothetical protein A3E78_09220 [Alphaproteobacteria bacterium RIFCSPHIGHO2_12_FULL_63_12]|nr:MAG: hypothetical protein A3E78_09220 [Alphaproteobacteria bacterium RIFCSPHIGHO2_12_FULL_63_12]
MSVKDYGEPWTIYGPSKNDAGDICPVNRHDCGVDSAAMVHAVACVNALAGLDPSKLVALIEAANAVRDIVSERISPIPDEVWRFNRALAALRAI